MTRRFWTVAALVLSAGASACAIALWDSLTLAMMAFVLTHMMVTSIGETNQTPGRRMASYGDM